MRQDLVNRACRLIKALEVPGCGEMDCPRGCGRPVHILVSAFAEVERDARDRMISIFLDHDYDRAIDVARATIGVCPTSGEKSSLSHPDSF
jgi:hypothetical protein